MAEKSVAEKLLIKPGYRVFVLHAPAGYEAAAGPLPAGARALTAPSGEPADLIELFVTSAAELAARLPGVKALLKPKGLLWVLYPKGTSKVKTDVNRDTIRAHAATVGWQAVALVSVDETWSALRLKPA